MNANHKTIFAAAALLCAMGAARADDPTPDPYKDWVSTKSRAEVIEEMQAARAQGSLGMLEREDSGSTQLARNVVPSTLTRQQVIDEVLAARAAGVLGAAGAEDSGSFLFARKGHNSPGVDAQTFAGTAR